jgi:hypothetical protein
VRRFEQHDARIGSRTIGRPQLALRRRHAERRPVTDGRPWPVPQAGAVSGDDTVARGARHDGAERLSRLFPDYPHWRGILDRLGIGREAAARLAVRARENGTDFQAELLASGDVEEGHVFSEIARELGLSYVEHIDPRRLLIRPEHGMLLLRRGGWHAPVKIEERNGRTALLVVPERICCIAIGGCVPASGSSRRARCAALCWKLRGRCWRPEPATASTSACRPFRRASSSMPGRAWSSAC